MNIWGEATAVACNCFILAMQPECREQPEQFINQELVPYFIQDGAVLYNSYLSSKMRNGENTETEQDYFSEVFFY